MAIKQNVPPATIPLKGPLSLRLLKMEQPVMFGIAREAGLAYAETRKGRQRRNTLQCYTFHNIYMYIYIYILCIPKHTVFPTMFPKYSYILSLSNCDHVSTVPSGVIKPWQWKIHKTTCHTREISIATITKVRPLNDQLVSEALTYISYPSYMRQLNS